MTVFLKLTILVPLTILMHSCNTNKTITQSDNSSESNMDKHTKLSNDGYLVGTIKHLKNSACNYIIEDKKTNTKFDPINIDEEKFKQFRSSEKEIYYKYLPLRMMNRCPEANPIKLLDVKERE